MGRTRSGWIGIATISVVLVFATMSGAQGRRRPGGRGGRQGAPDLKVGETAPDFNLVTLDSLLARQKDEGTALKHVKLSDWRGKRPVTLLFSSYT